MSEHDVVAATRVPNHREGLAEQLRALGICAGDLLLVHSSLSALGWVIGGAASVVSALLDAVGPTGTLVMPAHNAGLSDPGNWKNPPMPADWIDMIRAHRPAFDPDCTPTAHMGAIPELFRSWPGVMRSDHPWGSFCARGPLAAEVLQVHELSAAFGDASPLGALYQRGAKVLLLGVGHEANTSLHLGEYRAQWKGKPYVDEGVRMMVDGESRWVSFTMVCWDEDDFVTLGAAYEAAHDFALGPVGNAECRLLQMPSMVDFATTWIESNR